MAEGEAWKPLPVTENPAGQCAHHISAPHGIHMSSGGASLPPVISGVATVPLHDPLLALPFRLPSTFHRGSCRPWAPRERPTRAHAPSPISHLTVPGSRPMDWGSEALPERRGVELCVSILRTPVRLAVQHPGWSVLRSPGQASIQRQLELVRPPGGAMVMGLRGPGGGDPRGNLSGGQVLCGRQGLLGPQRP